MLCSDMDMMISNICKSRIEISNYLKECFTLQLNLLEILVHNTNIQFGYEFVLSTLLGCRLVPLYPSHHQLRLPANHRMHLK